MLSLQNGHPTGEHSTCQCIKSFHHPDSVPKSIMRLSEVKFLPPPPHPRAQEHAPHMFWVLHGSQGRAQVCLTQPRSHLCAAMQTYPQGMSIHPAQAAQELAGSKSGLVWELLDGVGVQSQPNLPGHCAGCSDSTARGQGRRLHRAAPPQLPMAPQELWHAPTHPSSCFPLLLLASCPPKAGTSLLLLQRGLQERSGTSGVVHGSCPLFQRHGD